MVNQKKYSIELTEDQLRLICNACELSSRLRSGQFHELREIFHDLAKTVGVKNLTYENEEMVILSIKKLFGLQSGESIGIRQSGETARELYEIYYLIRNFFAIQNDESSVNVYRNELLEVTDQSKITIKELK